MTHTLALPFLFLAVAACTHEPRRDIVVLPDCRTAEGAQRESCADQRSPRVVRSGGRSAGAGGSHAPGGTGLGIGTNPSDGVAEIGTTR